MSNLCKAIDNVDLVIEDLEKTLLVLNNSLEYITECADEDDTMKGLKLAHNETFISRYTEIGVDYIFKSLDRLRALNNVLEEEKQSL